MNIGNLDAQILYYPLPWEEIVIDETEITCLHHKMLRASEMFNPTEKPGFWKEVQQLYFAFEQNDFSKVKNFYYTYGKIGSLDKENRTENIQEVKHRLNWFRLLTVMVNHIKNQKDGPLWDLFNEGEYLGYDVNGHPISRFFLLGDELSFNIAFTPWMYLDKKGKAQWILPSNNDEIFIAAWQAVSLAIQDAFRRILAIPAPQNRNVPISPITTLHLYCQGALDAAFLQWMFEEVSYMNIKECSAKDCSRPVVPPRTIYCSDKCKHRIKKRRYRERQKGE